MNMVLTNHFEYCDQLLLEYGYELLEQNTAGRLYTKNDSPAVFIDTTLFQLELSKYQYVDYTSYQNQLMHKYQGLYRFVYHLDTHSLSETQTQLQIDLDIFLGSEEQQPDKIKKFGADRSESHTDPTPPEYNFTQLFEEVFGSQYLHALEAESKYIDSAGHIRYIDFVLTRTNGSTNHSHIAVELNGERYHHPLIIGLKKYRSQLFKQNSLVYDGYLVFRWSSRGMSDHYKFSDQMRDYFGDPKSFSAAPKYLAQRDLSFQLLEHQDQAVNSISKQRAKGKSTFLVVLPTGTGKTEVFIEDLKNQIDAGICKKALAVVPSTALKKQLKERLSLRHPLLKVGELLTDSTLDIVVQTSAYMMRHYSTIQAQVFDYILIDEAHHAVATGLRKVIEYFKPKTLLGLTATDERADDKKLQDIFGRYKVDLTLEQAIKKGLAPQIRAYRLQSNIDLSQVRFNGKDYVKADLNKTVLVPSRDQLIVDLINKYFAEPLIKGQSLKQGVVFCTDIKHAQRMAKLFNKHGISAQAVHGSDRKGLDKYQKGDIRFLCACDLLNEGWDAPQTEILVMARPTMSKVLYTQQLGRGTRNYKDKEALIVIDVVDSYGAGLQPMSVHGLFNFTTYKPFENLIKKEVLTPESEAIELDRLYEGERRIEKINIFTFEHEFGGLLNEEQLARELFISTGTVKSWIKKGDITPTRTHPFGKHTLNYFSVSQLKKIKIDKNIKERTEESRRDDFFEFLQSRDYSFSYKIAFLLAFISECNAQGEAELSKIILRYQNFYKQLHQEFGQAEKDNNPLNDKERLNDGAYLTRSLLANPFEKFERKRFIYHAKDLNIISFDSVLWEKLDENALAEIKQQYIQDGKDYYQKVGLKLQDHHFKPLLQFEEQVDNTVTNITPTQNGNDEELFTSQLKTVNEVFELPYFPNLKIACGHFKTGDESDMELMDAPLGAGKLDPQVHFLARASGDSMNGGKHPIVDGDLLLLELITPDKAGSLRGQIVAIEQGDVGGAGQYLLRKVKKLPNGQYELIAQNPDYGVLIADESMRTFARFKQVVAE
jgi:superfamily II DNA or RNA helicase/phage repressor protein C with HTH and peptisase S24 domain